ncbi:MAG: hypothetical protein DRO76_02605 [Candidatus Altiarchaeales archaeon]|nr:MAG: hypothetical protein DRO76_02605 [Candidatus Altiarchaeales archaeon]
MNLDNFCYYSFGQSEVGKVIIKILKENTSLMAICLSIFIIGTPFGFIFFEETEEALLPNLKQIKEKILTESKSQTALNIFFNNLIVSLILLAGGTFIILPFFIMFTNGFLVGFIIKLLLEKNLGLIFFIKGIILHSVFELPAIFISAAMGIRIGLSYLTRDNKRRVSRVSQRIREAAVIYLLVVIPLLLIAAFVEAFISAELVM